MVRSLAEVYGDALIASSYHITVKTLNDKESFVNIQVNEPASAQPLTREHRSILTAANEFMHRQFEWDSTSLRGYDFGPKRKSEHAIIHEVEMNSIARDIRNLSRQRSGRVPDNKEARAMAELACMARVLICMRLTNVLRYIADHMSDNVRSYSEFDVQDETQFYITCNRDRDFCNAELYVEGKPRLVAKGIGSNHFQAMDELEKQVGVRAHRRKLSDLMRYHVK